MGFTISTRKIFGTDDKSHENPGTSGTKLEVFEK